MIADQAGRWAANTLRLDVPQWIGAMPTLPTTGTTQRRSWLGLTGAVTTAVRWGLLPPLSASLMLDRIVAFQQPNGIMGTDGTPNNHFLLPELAQGILWVGDACPPGRIEAWTAALVKGATTMRDGIPGAAGRESTWWTNGNIEVLEALAYYLTWLATDDVQWRAAYDQQIGFLYDPPDTGSATGQGLVLTQQPADASGDWRDARGYLTENSGYDPDYTQFQATCLARLYEWSHDVRVLRLLNATLGTVLGTLNPGTMRFDGVGTRKTYQNGVVLQTPATGLLAWSGLRPDLAPVAEASWRLVVRSIFPAEPAAVSEWLLRSYSDIVCGWLRAARV